MAVFTNDAKSSTTFGNDAKGTGQIAVGMPIGPGFFLFITYANTNVNWGNDSKNSLTFINDSKS